MRESGVNESPIAMTDRVFRAPEILINECGGESVILCPRSQSYHSLDEVGTRMWTLLSESHSIQAAYEQLVEEYDACPDRLRADLMDLVSDLCRHQLIEVHRA